jgi:hypothetical protein
MTLNDDMFPKVPLPGLSCHPALVSLSQNTPDIIERQD